MYVSEQIWWEKWRPKNIDDVILPKRIKDLFINGIDGNYLFHGHYGTGKTSLARILIGVYTKDKSYIEINSSLETSIEVLRTEIEDWCKYQPIFDNVDSKYRYVFLDEFDGTSSKFQDGFKAFIEKYSKRGIRFILTTNKYTKIGDGIHSRIFDINFNCENIEEEKFLKREIYKRIKHILSEEGRQLDKNIIVDIINKKFPDFRATLLAIELATNGYQLISSGNSSLNIKKNLYNFIYKEECDYEEIYHFLMENFGADRVSELINLLGKPFIDWSISEKKNIDKLFDCNYIIADYGDKLEGSTDPIILGMTILGKFRNILLK